MNSMKRILLAVALLLFSLATDLTANSKNVVEADEKMVESCKFLQTITKKPFIGNVKTARKSVMKAAGKLGATHVVFMGFEGANAVTFASATARAYDCTNKTVP